MAELGWTDADYAHEDDRAPATGGLTKAINIIGALASLALVVGVGIWGYKLIMRDVSGVPVVRALAGPMRVQPDNPGGRPADNQGLAVNAVAAHGAAAPPAEKLLLAPRPVSLTDEDQPVAALTRGAAQRNARDLDQRAVDALVERLVSGTKPIDRLPEDATVTRVAAAVPTPTEVTETAPQSAVFDGPGLARSLRPVLRPTRTALAAASDTAPAVTEVSGDALPAGTRLAQLGAFETADLARAEWHKLDARFEDYLSDKIRVIQKSSSGGREFYRLRAMGFADLSDARRFCAVLVAENTDCIPVTTR